MIALGIDIGLTGAMSAVDSRGTCSVHDLPVIEDASGKRIDAAALIKGIRDLIPAGIGGFIVMENIRVRAMAGHAMSHKTETSLVLSRGVVQAVADIARIPVRTVEPQVWKRWYGLGKEKGAALEVARRLYPCAEHMLKRQKDHNRAEALLIAHWGRSALQ